MNDESAKFVTFVTFVFKKYSNSRVSASPTIIFSTAPWASKNRSSTDNLFN